MVRGILLGFWAISVFVALGGRTNRKLVLFRARYTTWNHANLICKSHEMELVTIDSVDILNEISVQYHTWTFNYFWTGLHNADGGAPESLVWADCHPVNTSGTSWVSGAGDGRCGLGRKTDNPDINDVALAACNEAKGFPLCQNFTGECSFEEVGNRSLSVTTEAGLTDQVPAFGVTSLPECQGACQGYNNGSVECWAVQFNIAGSSCSLFTSDSMKNVRDSLLSSPDLGDSLYLKICVTGSSANMEYNIEYENQTDTAPWSGCTSSSQVTENTVTLTPAREIGNSSEDSTTTVAAPGANPSTTEVTLETKAEESVTTTTGLAAAITTTTTAAVPGANPSTTEVTLETKAEESVTTTTGLAGTITTTTTAAMPGANLSTTEVTVETPAEESVTTTTGLAAATTTTTTTTTAAVPGTNPSTTEFVLKTKAEESVTTTTGLAAAATTTTTTAAVPVAYPSTTEFVLKTKAEESVTTPTGLAAAATTTTTSTTTYVTEVSRKSEESSAEVTTTASITSSQGTQMTEQMSPLVSTPSFTDADTTQTGSATSNGMHESSPKCRCTCRPGDHASMEEKQKFTKYISDSLTIDVANLSSKKRRYVSAEDERTSSVAFGGCGVAILSLTFGAIFISDLSGFIPEFRRVFSSLFRGS